MANSLALTELKNCKLKNPSLLFGPLAQYLGSDKQRVLSPCVTYIHFPPHLTHLTDYLVKHKSTKLYSVSGKTVKILFC